MLFRIFINFTAFLLLVNSFNFAHSFQGGMTPEELIEQGDKFNPKECYDEYSPAYREFLESEIKQRENTKLNLALQSGENSVSDADKKHIHQLILALQDRIDQDKTKLTKLPSQKELHCEKGTSQSWDCTKSYRLGSMHKEGVDKSGFTIQFREDDVIHCIYSSPVPACGMNRVECGVDEKQDLLGCRDSSANNYNSEATMNDGSCSYDVSSDISGCMDSTASNYTPEATMDDGSCSYDLDNPIPGCTDSTASNYMPWANMDDATCWYEGMM